MAQQQKISTENNFIGGLKTDFTALNFPENAATETWDCVYTQEGDVLRRFGWDLEQFYEINPTVDAIGAVSSYRWLNAGGDGNTQIYVLQVGTFLYFYRSSDATVLQPLSTTYLASIIDMTPFAPGATTIDECQFADGNGYLFVYNKGLNPFYCTYDSTGTITATQIDIKIRDFKGIPDGYGVGGIGDIQERPVDLTDYHQYNLLNQGWTNDEAWSFTTSATDVVGMGYEPLSFTGNGPRGYGPETGQFTWTVPAGLPIEVGQIMDFKYTVLMNAYNIDEVQWFPYNEPGTGQAVIVSYSGTELVVNITVVSPQIAGPPWELNFQTGPFIFTAKLSDVQRTLDAFKEQVGIYPSNTDVWFTFKETETITTPTGTRAAEKFAPGHTVGIIQEALSQAPPGHFILDAFDQNRATVSNIAGLTDVSTEVRPRTGAWFQGRVWYAGIDASTDENGEQPFYTWTENIYFSQIIEDSSGSQFGKCYQFDDPTDENNFLLLPTDGGVITIQGSGSIYKLFVTQNGLLVFAANGIWFITGSSGIGFNAADYTVTKISAVRSISGSSFVDVNGLPYFWNEESIYAVEPAQQGSGLLVVPLTNLSIDRFYEEIPYRSKLFARGSYDPVDYVVQWLYNSDPNATPTVSYDFEEGVYTFVLFDDCCHLFSSTDNGDTWLQANTPQTPLYPTDSMNDDWIDSAMAINDGNKDTIVVYSNNEAYSDPGNAALGPGATGGYICVNSHSFTSDGWDVIVDPWTGPPSPSYSFVSFTGDISTAANILLVLPGNFATSGIVPRISRDGGATFSDITIDLSDIENQGLIAGRYAWGKACFSANAQHMYMTVQRQQADSTYKSWMYASHDQGVTWSQLPNFVRTLDTSFARNLATARVRCSADGRVIVYVDQGNNLGVSTDYGMTWTMQEGFAIDVNATQYADCGISADGSCIVVFWDDFSADYFELGYSVRNVVYKSTDEGVTWTNITPSEIFEPTYYEDNLHIINCNISPDGLAIIVAYESDTGASVTTAYTKISLDQGETWTEKTFPMDEVVPGSLTGLFTTAFVAQSFTSTDVDVDSTGHYFNRALNYRIPTKAWYPWTITSDDGDPLVYDIKYVQNPGGVGAPDGVFKYVTSVGLGFTFSECYDTSYLDWDYDGTGTNYESYFLTGFKLHGQAIRKWQPEYIQMYSRNDVNTKYHIQGVFNFATDPNSGRWSNKQVISIQDKTQYGMWKNKIRIRGSGLVTQLRVSSIDDNPFDIMGWAIMENQNPNV